MADVATLTQRLEALREVRASGQRSVRFGEDEVTYRSDAEIAAAIADVERQLLECSGRVLPRIVNVRSTKGW